MTHVEYPMERLEVVDVVDHPMFQYQETKRARVRLLAPHGLRALACDAVTG